MTYVCSLVEQTVLTQSQLTGQLLKLPDACTLFGLLGPDVHKVWWGCSLLEHWQHE